MPGFSRQVFRTLHPGPGYGGSCFPKDTLALMRIVQEYGESVRIVEAAVEVNSAQKARGVPWEFPEFRGQFI